MFKEFSLLLGAGLLAVSQVIFSFVFYPVILSEIKYYFQTSSEIPRAFQVSDIQTVDEFRIIIPKIDINSKVLPNIDPFNKKEYQEALSQGVAQAKGSALPGEPGNIFIFAHSTNSPFIAQYNAFFYLINKLTAGDEIYLTYHNRNYKYVVTDTKIIQPSGINYLKPKDKTSSLTLMTCWPPGTTLKRLLVISRLTKE